MTTDTLQPHHFRKHRYHSPLRRGFHSLLLIAGTITFSTVGIRALEGFSWVDSFYFTSMIATGQGPPPSITPLTPAGKLFTCLMAFVSVGVMLTSFGLVFGPFFGKLWRIGVAKIEEEVHHLHRPGSPKS